MQRRALLVALVTGATAGCSDVLGSPEARLGHFDLINYDDEPRIFHIEIERDGNTVRRLSRRVTTDVPSTIPVADRTWGTKPGRYTLTVSVGSDRADATFTESGCQDVIIDYRSGDVGIFSHNDGKRCLN